MIKKLLLGALAAAMLFSMSACGMGDFSTSAPAATESGAGSEAASSAAPIDQAKFKDNLEGLVGYLSESGLLKTDGAKVEMDPEFIGAKAGVKYNFSNEGSNNVTVELYEYDLENTTAEAKAVLDSVKLNNSLSVMSQTVGNAYVSDSGKYLMLYGDSATADVNNANKDRAIELLKGFKPA